MFFTAFALSASLSGCGMAEPDIWSEVTFEVVLPEGYADAEWSLQETSYFVNQNTKEKFSFPDFSSMERTVRVTKGYYLLGLYVEATSGGKVTYMYNADHNSPEHALYVTEDMVTVSLELSLRQK